MEKRIRRACYKSTRVMLVLAILPLIVACDLFVSPTEVVLKPSDTTLLPSSIPSATTELPPTATSTLTTTPTETATLTPTSTATPTPVCFQLLNPLDGSQLLESGRVKFEWESQSEAQNYLLEIIVPDGHMLAFETFNTFVERYLNTLPWEGIYSWRVAAMNTEGGVLCIVGPFSFSKPQLKPSPTLASRSLPSSRKPKQNIGRGEGGG